MESRAKVLQTTYGQEKNERPPCKWGIRSWLSTDSFQLMMKQSPRSDYSYVPSI